MPAYTGRIVIAGVAESDYGRVPNMTEMQLHAQALMRALEDSGLRKEEIDGVFCSSQMMGMPTVMLCEYLRIFPRYSDSTSIGGSSFEAHLNHAVAAIRAGKCEVALISSGMRGIFLIIEAVRQLRTAVEGCYRRRRQPYWENKGLFEYEKVNLPAFMCWM